MKSREGSRRPSLLTERASVTFAPVESDDMVVSDSTACYNSDPKNTVNEFNRPRRSSTTDFKKYRLLASRDVNEDLSEVKDPSLDGDENDLSVENSHPATASVTITEPPRSVTKRESFNLNEQQPARLIKLRPSSKQRSVVFLDFSCSERNIERVLIELFENICPKTCENFRMLCAGTGGLSSTGTPLHYKGTKVFRVIPNFLIQGGDVTRDDGTGGESVWAKKDSTKFSRYFPDENFIINHHSCGLVAMANRGPNTNQSQFYISCAPLPWLDGRNVIFGKVIRGLKTLALIEQFGSPSGAVQISTRIADCGVLENYVSDNNDVIDMSPSDVSIERLPSRR